MTTLAAMVGYLVITYCVLRLAAYVINRHHGIED
jgi:hypothetical protein